MLLPSDPSSLGLVCFPEVLLVSVVLSLSIVLPTSFSLFSLPLALSATD